MNIQIKSNDANTTIAADASWKVSQLKEAIEKDLKVPVAAQKLTVGGKIMKNDKTLADYSAAATQAVNLMVAAGTVKAAPAGDSNKSEDRKQIDGLVSEMISIIKQNKEVRSKPCPL